MPWALPTFLEQFRERFGMLKASRAQSALDPTGDNSLALRACEAQTSIARRVQQIAGVPYLRNNRGWFVRHVQTTIQADGRVLVPADCERQIAATSRAAAFDRLAYVSDLPQLMGDGDCLAGQWIPGGYTPLFRSNRAGQTVYLVYNSNLQGLWTAGTVASATAGGSGASITLTPSATPLYATLDVSPVEGIYDLLSLQVTRPSTGAKQDVWVKHWDGTTFTFYETAWPRAWTPTSTDRWSILSAVPCDELLLYELLQVTPQAPRKDHYLPRYATLTRDFERTVRLAVATPRSGRGR